MAQSGGFTSRIREDRNDVWDESRDFGFEWRSQKRREPRRTAHDARGDGRELRSAVRPRVATEPPRPSPAPAPRVEPPPPAASRRRPSAEQSGHEHPGHERPSAERPAATSEAALTRQRTSPGDGEPTERRTVVIRGRGDDRLYGTASRRRPARPRHERSGFRADRTAMWAVVLGIAMLLVAAMSAHGAVIVGH